MFSAEGYVSLKELEDTVRQMEVEGFTSNDLHARLRKVGAMYLTDGLGVVVRLSEGVMALANDGEYIFISRDTWTVNLNRIRAAYHGPDNLAAGLYILSAAADDDETDELSESLSEEYLQGLMKFEGWALMVKDQDFHSLIEGLKSFSPTIDITRHSDEASLVAAFEEFVDVFESDSRPTPTEANDWRISNGISRDRMRALRNDHAPPHWSNPGKAPNRKRSGNG